MCFESTIRELDHSYLVKNNLPVEPSKKLDTD